MTKPTLNTSQRHGNEFEDMVRISSKFSGTVRIEDKGQGSFDIPASCDDVLHLPTSVKTSGSDWVGLADAARFCGINRPWRLIYSCWEQKEEDGVEFKRYPLIHELIITLGVMRKVLGELDEATVLGWHLEIASFVSGPEGAAAARIRADEIKTEAEGRTGILRLDFKIDDKDQRRLQLSLQFSRLAALVDELDLTGPYRTRGHTQPHHDVHEGWFHQHRLPIDLRSSPRRIGKAAQADDATAGLFDDDAAILIPVAKADGDDVFGAKPASALKGRQPVRREERKRRSQRASDTGQTSIFG